MPSTYTPSLRLTLPATGELSGIWGGTVNTGITTLTDAAIAGYISIAMTDADYTLTSVDGAADQARYMMVNMTGTLTAAKNVICPAASKVYIFKNSTTGGFALTLKTPSGAGISVPNGKAMLLICNGTAVIDAITNFNALTLTSPTLTAPALGTPISGVLSSCTGYPSANLSGAVPATLGGTGQTVYAVGDVVYASTTTALSKLSAGTTKYALISNGAGVAPSYQQVSLTAGVTGTLPVANGGTNITTYAIGDILYASGTGALSSLLAAAAGNVLISGTTPSWGKVGLTTHVSGTLPVANGGTNATAAPTAGAIAYGTGTAYAFTAAGTAGQVLSSNGAGVPTWTAASGGTVTSVSVASANGFAGTSSGGATPALTLSTSVSGMLKGSGAALTTATAGTDYVAPGGALGTPSSGTLTSCTGLPISTGVSGLGTNVAAFLGAVLPSSVATFLGTPNSSNLAAAVSDETGTGSLVFGTAPTVTNASLVTPILGTPQSGTLTSCTGLPISTGVSGLGAGVSTFLGTPSSANLLAAVTGETGTGALVFGTSPALTTPSLAGETFSTNASVAAGTNLQGQGALTSDYNVIITTAVNPSGVTLPAATVGRRVIVVNKGTNPINIYPAAGGAIDALGTNAALSLIVSGWIEFNASSATQWYSTANIIVTSTGAVTSFNAGSTGLTPSTATTGNVTLAGTLVVANGGTGTTTATGSGSVVLANSPALITPSLGTPTSGTLTNCTGYSAVNISGTVAVTSGGTGQTSYVVGDLLYASTTTALSKLAGVATGNSLLSGGVGVAPLWGKIGLTTHISGTLGVANGGTGITTTPSVGTIPYGTGSVYSLLAAGTAGQVLTSGGAAAPTWSTLPTGTVTSVSIITANGFTGSVANASTTPAITISSSVSGIVKGDGTGLSAAIANTDYLPVSSPAMSGTPTAPTAPTVTNTTQVATTAFVQAVLQAMHPVGSIYLNATNSSNPSILLGFGTWASFGAGRMPVGFDATNPLFNASEETGGTANAVVVSHDHTATTTLSSTTHTHSGTTSTVADHVHPSGIRLEALSATYGTAYVAPSGDMLDHISGPTTNSTNTLGAGSHNHTITTGNNSATPTASTSVEFAGVSGTDQNYPPYITVYMWKRTA